MTSIALMSCMRNEGIHILEWLAYHKVIGFGPIVVCTNDCDDGSDHLLDTLATAGEVDHLPNPAPEGNPQLHGIQRVHSHLSHSPADWLAHLDSDEFLNIGPGAGPVADLVARAGAAHAIALPWHSFGDNGHDHWPGETLRAFTACETAVQEATVKFKSLYRFRAFRSASEHMPTDAIEPNPVAVNAAGVPLHPAVLSGKPRSRYSPVPLAMQGGTVVNHYAVRSTDVFLLKQARGLGSGPPFRKYSLNSAWHRRANRNDRQDRTILRRWPEVAVELARLRALPAVTAAEAACLAWFRQQQATAPELRIVRRRAKGRT